MKSPVPYLTDAEYSILPLGDRTLHMARSQVGVTEVPSGSNWGPMVKVYLAAAGWKSPASWCAAFIVWCAIGAGAKRSLLWTTGLASTFRIHEWAKKSGRLKKEPKRGDLFVWFVPGTGGHTGIVAEVVMKGKVPYVRTIEGNTNFAGGREGVAVMERLRSVASIMDHPLAGFVDLKGLDR